MSHFVVLSIYTRMSFETWTQLQIESAEREVHLAELQIRQLFDKLAAAESLAYKAREHLKTTKQYVASPEAKKEFFGRSKQRHEAHTRTIPGYELYIQASGGITNP